VQHTINVGFWGSCPGRLTNFYKPDRDLPNGRLQWGAG
jgi:hypothetical protein